MKQVARVLGVLDRGPATARDVADETGLPQRTASAVLCKLRKHGFIVSWPLQRDTAGRPCCLFALK
jgi:predicted ArsR family transcriptional regulator